VTARRNEIFKAWVPSLIWMGIIAVESTAWLSASNTSRFLYPICHFLFGVSREHFPVWNFYLRKTGHFVGYFTMSFLLFRSWRATLPQFGNGRWALRWSWIAWLMTTFIASMDEWHQTFIPGRTGTVHDVILDSTAALVAQIVLFLFLRRAKTRVA
jgi:VanZ family protein